LQLQIKIAKFSILEFSQLKCKLIDKDIIINATTLTIEVSLSLADKLLKHLEIAKRDLAYYQEKIKVNLKNKEIVN